MSGENPPAFPSGDFRGVEPGYGMSLRDWFAGQALAAVPVDRLLLKRAGEMDQLPEEHIARVAYSIADAMLKQREAGNVG